MFSFIEKYRRKRQIIKAFKLAIRQVKEIQASEGDPLLMVARLCAVYTRLECIIRQPIKPRGLKACAQIARTGVGEAILKGNIDYAAAVEFENRVDIKINGKDIYKRGVSNE